MSIGAIARFLSTAFLALAIALVGYGLYGMSRFAWYRGMYVDDSFILFDNGFYPFFWGCLFLLMGQVFRLHWRRQFMLLASIAGLALFAWKRITIPVLGTGGQEIFPDAALLNELLVVCGVILSLALADRYVQLVIDAVIVNPFRRIVRKKD